ncbi:MAG: hypothetical protein HY313_00750 [Acidobacteria bacterium]|nr:hypothetical protein [Acidobacteriota bacterium]
MQPRLHIFIRFLLSRYFLFTEKILLLPLQNKIAISVEDSQVNRNGIGMESLCVLLIPCGFRSTFDTKSSIDLFEHALAPNPGSMI